MNLLTKLKKALTEVTNKYVPKSAVDVAQIKKVEVFTVRKTAKKAKKKTSKRKA
jgi:hypothetical protein